MNIFVEANRPKTNLIYTPLSNANDLLNLLSHVVAVNLDDLISIKSVPRGEPLSYVVDLKVYLFHKFLSHIAVQ